MRRSSKDKNKTSPGPSGPGEVASGLVRILPKPVSQSSRHRIFSAIAADPCPKHPAGRRFPPPGGIRREPPVPDFAASHLAGSGFMMVWRDARANLLCVFPKFQDLFPNAAASSPEGATCRWRGHVAIGQILSLSGPQAAGPTGRLHSPDMFTSGPSESTSILRFRALSRSCHSREASGVCAAILVRRDADYPSTQSELSFAFWRSGLLPVPAFLLGRLDSPGMGYGIRDGASSC